MPKYGCMLVEILEIVVTCALYHDNSSRCGQKEVVYLYLVDFLKLSVGINEIIFTYDNLKSWVPWQHQIPKLLRLVFLNKPFNSAILNFSLGSKPQYGWT